MSQRQQKQQQQQSSSTSSASNQASSASATTGFIDQLRRDLHQFVDQAIDRLRESFAVQRDAEIDRLTRSNAKLAALLSHERSVTKHQAQQLRILRDSTTHHANEFEAAASPTPAAAAVTTGMRKRRTRDASDSSMSIIDVQATEANRRRRRLEPAPPSKQQPSKRRRTQPAALTTMSPPLSKQQQQQQPQQQQQRRRSARLSKTNDEDATEESTLTDREFGLSSHSSTSSLIELKETTRGIELSPPSRRGRSASVGGARRSVVNHLDLQLNATGASVVAAAGPVAFSKTGKPAQVGADSTGADLTDNLLASTLSTSDVARVPAVCNFQQLDSTTLMPTSAAVNAVDKKNRVNQAAQPSNCGENSRPKLGGSPTSVKVPTFKPPLPPGRSTNSTNKKSSNATNVKNNHNNNNNKVGSVPSNQPSNGFNKPPQTALLSPLYCSTLRVNSRDFDPESDKPLAVGPAPKPTVRISKREAQ